MKRINYVIILLMLLVLSLLSSACELTNNFGKTETTNIDNYLSSLEEKSSLEKQNVNLIKSFISKEVGIVNEFRVLKNELIENTAVSFFEYSLNNKLFEGVAYTIINRNDLTIKSYSVKESDISSPFTINIFKAKDPELDLRDINYITGYVNDKKITYLRILFANNSQELLYLNGSSSYFLKSVGGLPKKIVGMTLDGKIIESIEIK